MQPDPYALNLSYIIRLFNLKYPDIGVTPVSPNLQNYTATPESIFRDESYDFIITHQSMCIAEQCELSVLADDYYVALFSKEFPGDQRDFEEDELITTTELDGMVFISAETGQWCEHIREKFCVENGIRPSAVIRQTRNRERILFNLSMYGGVAVFYRSDLRAFNLDSFYVVKIADVPHDPYVLAVRSEKN